MVRACNGIMSRALVYHPLRLRLDWFLRKKSRPRSAGIVPNLVHLSTPRWAPGPRSYDVAAAVRTAATASEAMRSREASLQAKHDHMHHCKGEGKAEHKKWFESPCRETQVNTRVRLQQQSLICDIVTFVRLVVRIEAIEGRITFRDTRTDVRTTCEIGARGGLSRAGGFLEPKLLLFPLPLTLQPTTKLARASVPSIDASR